MRGKVFLTVGIFLSLLPASPPAQAQAQAAWVQLGCRDVNMTVDRDVVRVGRRDGRFSHIRLRASGNAVQMLDVKVVYGNGAPDDLPVRARIAPGTPSGPLDLRGHDRAIDRVELVYASVPNFRGKATVCVEGRMVVAQAPGGGWVQLGCRDVDLNGDRDVVRVERREGRFSAIRLRASGNVVHMLDLKVVYGNGSVDDLPVRARIPEGGTSGVLDLRGRDRAIDRIEMVYTRVPNFRGRARICVEGRAA